MRFIRILIHDEVDVCREARIPVKDSGHAANDDVADRSVLERSEDGFEQGHCRRGSYAGPGAIIAGGVDDCPLLRTHPSPLHTTHAFQAAPFHTFNCAKPRGSSGKLLAKVDVEGLNPFSVLSS